MRYIFGTIGIIAALAIVLFSAVATYYTAHSMTTQFQELAGAAAAGMVGIEALSAFYVWQCWRNRVYVMAFCALLVALASTAYILRIDLRFYVTGQSDLTASREANVENRESALREHSKAIARRDELQKLRSPSAFERRELEKAERRIADLEPKLWTSEIVASSGMPEAGWASRMLGSDRQLLTDWLMVAGLIAWAIVRMLALPVAVASMQPAPPARRKPVEATQAPGTIIVPPMPSPAPVASPEAPKARIPVLTISEGDPWYQAIASAKMDPRHDHLNALLDETPPPLALKDETANSPKISDSSDANPPSEKVGQLQVDDLIEEDGEDPVFSYNTKLRLSKREIRRLAKAQNANKKKFIDEVDEPDFVDFEVWAGHLLRVGTQDQYVTSKDCRVNIREYAELFGYNLPDKKMISREVGKIVDRLTGVERAKGERRARNAGGTVWYGVYLLKPEDLAKLSPERVRA